MKSSIKSISVDKIDHGKRNRPVDPNWAKAIAASIEQYGLLNPITVAENKERFSLAAGAHRLTAIQSLGEKTIEARVFAGDDVPDAETLRRLEATENIVRKDLSVLERAISLWELKQDHERRHPGTRHGGKRRPQANDNANEFQVAVLATWSKRFTAEIADECGLSERSIRVYVKIARQIEPEIRAKLFRTWLANHQAGLIALSDQSPGIQVKIYDLLFGDDSKATDVNDALTILAGKPVKSDMEKFLTRTMGTWGRMSRSYQFKFFEHNEADVRRYAKKKGWID